MTAVFIGWQEDVEGYPPIALFNVVAKGDPRDGTTVDVNSLKEWGIKIPSYPKYQPKVKP
jgi:hypothetical protein